jgi:hypothetical protein
MFTLENAITAIMTWSKKHPLLTFFMLAYALSWMVEIPLALKVQGVIQVKIPFSLHYLAAYGPMLSALIVTGVTGGIGGLRELWERMTRWKVNPGWWLVAVAPLGLYLAVNAALWLIQGVSMNLVVMGQVDFLPDLGLAALPL